MQLPPKMSLAEYNAWIYKPITRSASLPSFFPSGVERTRNVLRGTATKESVGKWRSFGARHYAQYKKNPTERRAIALRNWGFRVAL